MDEDDDTVAAAFSESISTIVEVVNRIKRNDKIAISIIISLMRHLSKLNIE